MKRYIAPPGRDVDPDQWIWDLDIRDLHNQEDALKLGPIYLGAYRARMNANLAFWDGIDQKTDWPLGAHDAHPLTELRHLDR